MKPRSSSLVVRSLFVIGALTLPGCSENSDGAVMSAANGGGGATSGAGGAAGDASSQAGAGATAGGGAGTNANGGNAGSNAALGGNAGTLASSGGASGSAGSSASGGQSGQGGGAPTSTPSLGCNTPAAAKWIPEMYVRTSISGVAKTPKGADRVYELRLPKDYDDARAYPLVFEDHGCDGSIPFHMEKASGTDAVVVALRAASNQDNNYMGGCFATGPGDAELTEVPYFDAVLKEVSGELCIDQSRVFMEGYSSGSWLTNLLGCVRAGVLRGQGNATGGLPVVPAQCAGPIAALLAHDDTDTMNTIQEGEKARDRIKAMNGCSDQTEPYEWDTNPNTVSTCVAYQGCKPGYPLIWCPTHGKGHSDQVPITTTGLWKFWSALPQR